MTTDPQETSDGTQGSELFVDLTEKPSYSARALECIWNWTMAPVWAAAAGSSVTPAAIGAIILLALLVLIAAVGLGAIFVLLFAAILLLDATLNALILVVVVFIATIVALVIVFFVGVCVVALGSLATACCVPLVVLYFAWPVAPLWAWLIAEVTWGLLLFLITNKYNNQMKEREKEREKINM